MTVLEELYKIKDAFGRVKRDIQELRRSVLLLQKEKAEKSTETFLLEEIGQLKARLREVEQKAANPEVREVIVGEYGNAEDYIIVGHKESKKVHIGSCPYSKKITEENRVVFGMENTDAEEQALKQGYKRCMCLKDKHKDHQ